MGLRDVVNKYHIWDARNIATLLPEKELIDVTITSPPYWNVKDYGVRNQIGFGQRYNQYLDDIDAVFSNIRDRTKATGSLWVVSDTFKEDGELKLLPFDISRKLTDTGWILQDLIIWQKDRALPWSHQGKLRNIFEYIAFYSKTKSFKYDVSKIRDVIDLKDYWIKYPERYSPEGKTPTRTWHVSIPRQGSWGKAENYVRHACPLPPELIRRIIDLTTDPGDIVLDPFAGSGSVLATARAMKRRYIGLDLNRRSQSMFVKRVLPALASQSRQLLLKGDDDGKKLFGNLVSKLRALKFAKEVVRLGRNTRGMSSCNAILVVPMSGSKVRYIFIFQRRRDIPKSFVSAVETISGRPPLSKYGIVPIIETVAMRSIMQKLVKIRIGPARKLSLYTAGRFWRSEQTTTQLRTLASAVAKQEPQRGYPLIVSTISVNLDPKRSSRAILSSNG